MEKERGNGHIVYGFMVEGHDGEKTICTVGRGGPCFDEMVKAGVIYPVMVSAPDQPKKKTIRDLYDLWTRRVRRKSKIKRKKHGPVFRWGGMSSANRCVIGVGSFLLRRPGCGVDFWTISHWPRDLSTSERLVWCSDEPFKFRWKGKIGARP